LPCAQLLAHGKHICLPCARFVAHGKHISLPCISYRLTAKLQFFFLISILFLISPLQRHYFVLYIPIYTFLDMFTIFNNFLSFKDFFRRSQI
jgi:hypothetical protein